MGVRAVAHEQDSVRETLHVASLRWRWTAWKWATPKEKYIGRTWAGSCHDIYFMFHFNQFCFVQHRVRYFVGLEWQIYSFITGLCFCWVKWHLSISKHSVAAHDMTNNINPLQPTGHVMHQQFTIQQLYALPTLYLCVLYLSENKQRLVPLTA